MCVILKNTNIVLQALQNLTLFQIKIVMKGTNSSYPPKISDMRAIALAV